MPFIIGLFVQDMKKLLSRLLFFSLLLAVLALGTAAWWALTPHRGTGQEVVQLEIKPGYGLRSIAAELQRTTGLSAVGFEIMSLLTGSSTRLRAGVYEVHMQDSPWRILDKMVKGESRLESVVIVEGWTFLQMRAAIEKHPSIRSELKGLPLPEWWQALALPMAHPEGAFFPDTYLFAPGTSDRRVYQMAYEAMQKELNRAWEQRMPGLPLRSPYEALILASIVEKETGMEADRRKIAGVFINRLNIGMRLQTDPTVIYGLGEKFDGNLRRRDLEADTPYNTYTRAGLPPTPIALPGRAALQAALNPDPTPALYFVARGDGSSQFSVTLDEHNRAVAKYQLGK
jgi:UPF0755 protein